MKFIVLLVVGCLTAHGQGLPLLRNAIVGSNVNVSFNFGSQRGVTNNLGGTTNFKTAALRFTEREHRGDLLLLSTNISYLGLAVTDTENYYVGRSLVTSLINVRRYNAAGTFQDITAFGDTDSRFDSILALTNNTLVMTWHQHTAEVGDNMTVYCAYRTNSTWYTNGPYSLDTDGAALTSPRVAICQHPVDGSIWQFWKRDSHQSIDAIRMTETGTNLAVTLYPKLISQAVDGDNGPEGELPYLNAITGTTNIWLAYERDVSIIFSAAPFIKGAQIAIAKLAADASLSFIPFTIYVEREDSFGLINSAGNPILIYRPISASTTVDQLTGSMATYWSVYYNGAWSLPAVMGLSVGLSAFAQSDGNRVYYEDEANLYHQVYFDPDPPIELKITTDKTLYSRGQSVYVTSRSMSGTQPLPDVAVSAQISSPRGYSLPANSYANENGLSVMPIYIPRFFEGGRCTVNVMVSKPGFDPATKSLEITVK